MPLPVGSVDPALPDRTDSLLPARSDRRLGTPRNPWPTDRAAPRRPSRTRSAWSDRPPARAGAPSAQARRFGPWSRSPLMPLASPAPGGRSIRSRAPSLRATFAYLTGWRKGEVLGLEWRNVTLDRRVGATVTLPAARSKFDRYDITSEADLEAAAEQTSCYVVEKCTEAPLVATLHVERGTCWIRTRTKTRTSAVTASHPRSQLVDS